MLRGTDSGRNYLPYSSTTSSASRSSWSCWSLVTSGRLPLCLVLVLILAFLSWHVATDETRWTQLLQEQTKQEAEKTLALETAIIDQLAIGVMLNPRQRLPIKASYRALVLGDSLTAGYQRNGELHPYLRKLEDLLQTRHSHLKIDFVLDAQPGECVISACVSKSMIERVNERLQQVNLDTKEHEYFDFAIILGGTNDIFHDFDAKDISHGLQTIHEAIWNQKPPVAKTDANGDPKPAVNQVVVHPKTLAITVPQFGDTDSWRPSHRPSKLHPTEVLNARTSINNAIKEFCTTRNPEQCTLINLDEWFPRHHLSPRELDRKWAEDVHPTPYGYDEMGLIIYQHLQHILPQN